MAVMIPAVCREDTESHAEVRLFQTIRSLFDDSWHVFHGFDLLARTEKNRLLDAEIDFLFFHPSYGMLILEVKGGAVRKNVDGSWYQNERKLDKSPAGQAIKGKYAVVDFLKKQFATDKLPFIYGHAVCFPDVFGKTAMPPDLDGILIDGDDVRYLPEAVTAILEKWATFKFKPLDPDYAGNVVRFLTRPFEYGTRLVDRIGQEEREFFSLTERQCDLLHHIRTQKKAVVSGCAGSGKTIMAVKKAVDLASAGKRVLLLCFNRLLGENIRKETSAHPNIHASTYHDLCFRYLGLRWEELTEPERNDSRFWEEVLPDRFDRFLRENPVLYDAVIVDEAQDFRLSFWVSILGLSSPEGWFYIFYDAGQNLFETKIELPFGEPFFSLDRNCRNTRSINEYLQRFLSPETQPAVCGEGTPQGEAVREIASSSHAESRKCLGQILHELVFKQNLSEDRIAVIGGHAMAHTAIGTNPSIGAFTLLENGPPGKQKIPYYSYYKFKGCETDAVIILDYDETDERWKKPAAAYTAMSRARHFLAVIRKERNVERKTDAGNGGR